MKCHITCRINVTKIQNNKSKTKMQSPNFIRVVSPAESPGKSHQPLHTYKSEMETRDNPVRAVLTGFDSIPDDEVVVDSSNATSIVSSADPSALVAESSESHSDKSEDMKPGPASGLKSFFAHRIRRTSGGLLVVDADPRGSSSNSSVNVKRERDTDGIVAVKQEILESTEPLRKKARPEAHSLKDVPIRFHAVIQNAYNIMEVTVSKHESLEKASKKVIDSLEKALECSKAARKCQETLIGKYEDSITVFNNKATECRDLQIKLMDKYNSVIATLKKKNAELRTQMDVRDEVIANREDEHDETLEEIRLSVNELRYVSEFGESSTHGPAICPISLNELMPNEAVMMLRADCNCNCMVSYEHARTFIDKFAGGEVVKCLICNSTVTSIEATTTRNGEKAFAWRNLEAFTECHSIGQVYEFRIAKLEKDKADKTLRDTVDLRNRLNATSSGVARA